MTTGKTIALSSNSEEAEVERFYEDLQDLLELTRTPVNNLKFRF